MPDVEWEEEIADLNLDDMEENTNEEQDKENINPAGDTLPPKTDGSLKPTPEQPKTEKFSMSFKEFQSLRSILLHEVRKRENNIELAGEEEDDEMPEPYGRESLSLWLLEHMEDVFSEEGNEGDLEEKRQLFRGLVEN